jgi:hypothetical protein
MSRFCRWAIVTTAPADGRARSVGWPVLTRYFRHTPAGPAEAVLRRRTARLLPGSRQKETRPPCLLLRGTVPPSGWAGQRGERRRSQRRLPREASAYAMNRSAAMQRVRSSQKERSGTRPRLQAAKMRMEESRLRSSRGISQLNLSVVQAKELISDAPHVACGTSLTLAKSMKS